MTLAAVTSQAGIAHSQTYPRTVPSHGAGTHMTDLIIYPVFIGDYWFTQSGIGDFFADIIYLADFVGYINGLNAPANQKPYLTQYGISTASLQPAIRVGWANGNISDASIVSELWSLQQGGQLPLIGLPNRLFMVFVGTGITPGAGVPGLGYHKDYTTTFSVFQTYGVVFEGSPVVTQIVGASHEIQEAATDPYWNLGTLGWAVDSSHEICDDVTCGDAPGTYQSFTANGITIIGCADNTQRGRCTTTGYIPK
jgi:hypothetical protein